MKNTIIIVFTIIALICNQNVSGQAVTDTVKTTEISIKGITCNGDMPVIKKKLINTEGIDEVTFSEAKSGTVVFKIIYHTSFINHKKICEIIESAPSCDNPGIYPYKAKVRVKNLKKAEK